MPPKTATTSKPATGESAASTTTSAPSRKNADVPASAGYLVTCDVPTKQFIQHLNELRPVDKKFILQDLDSTHLLVKHKAKDEIQSKVEEWLDENVYSAVEKVGEDLDTS